MIEGASVIVHSPTSETCLVIVGAIHGNEPAGPKAIGIMKELVTKGDWNVSGAVYGLIGNPEAMKRSVRFCDENLNRAFNGHISNSLEGKRAQEILMWLKEIAARHKRFYLLDIHSVSIGETRVVVFDSDNQRAESWAKEISPLPFRLGSPGRIVPGTLFSAVEKVSGCGLCIECGNHSSETGASVALEHIENALRSLGALSSASTSFKEKITYEGESRTYVVIDVIRTAPGFVFTVPDVRSEAFIKKGDVYARDNAEEHRAPVDCYLIMPSKVPQPEDFDAGFLAVRV